MTKDVLLSIKGLYAEDNENKDSIECLAPAEFYEKNGVYYIFFEEFLDSNGVTKSRIKYQDNCFELTRKGNAASYLLFEDGKKTLNTYQTPYGTLVVGLDTKEIKLTESEEEMKFHIEYGMDVNYQQVSENAIDIVIKSVNKSL